MENEKRTRCFIMEPCHRADESRIEEHGEVRYLFDRNSSRPGIWSNDLFKRAILDALKEQDYDPEVDAFVIVGSQVAVTIGITTIVSEYGRARALFFDAKDRNYVSRIVGGEETDGRRAERAVCSR